MDTVVICKDCGYSMSWHDENGMLSSAFGGMAPCDDAVKYLLSQQVENSDKDEKSKSSPEQDN